MNSRQALRLDIEEFLYAEARLLDTWQLEAWADLFTEDGMYLVPALDNPDGDPKATISLVADDLPRIQSRVRQLLGDTAWSENPQSKTRRLITNVEILTADEKEIRVTANFMVHRNRRERTDVYVGRYEYRLKRSGDRFKIRERKVFLDQDAMRPQNKLSIIV
ncbi:MAG: aromatic-ring-hydroxylating dioxygenase subunit beta [Betaproteobacteria bacterium]|nr:aromatic-ring-hydroxylating dioxygenase subunit beta [Betaproteobacteria bacterium]